jgi:hypothetical protein
MRFSVTVETRPQYDAYLREFARVVDDCVDFLNEGAQAITHADKADSPGDFALLLLVRHLTDSIDGVSILVARGSVQPCEPLLRSGLEAFLGIAYIREGDSGRRGLSFLLAEIHRQLKFYRQCDPDDEVGKQLRTRVTAEAIEGIIGKVPLKLARKKVAALRADLDDPAMKPVNEEWNRIKAASKRKKSPPCSSCGRFDLPGKKGDPEWYSLFGGPKNIEQLADKVKLSNLYQLMYRHWSGQTHAVNTMRNLHEVADAILLRPIRHPDGLVVMLRFSALLTLGLGLQLIRQYAPDSKATAKKRHDEICKAIREVERTKNVSWKASRFPGEPRWT